MPVGYKNGGSVEPRRARSLPSKYMIPSEEVGEYENAQTRRRSAPVKPSMGGLYPLDEQGAYAASPAKPGMPPSGVPFQRIRERKPKVYSSYSVDSDCQMHSQKLADAEKKLEEGIRRHSSTNGPPARSFSRASASPAPPTGRRSSQGPRRSPSRGSSSGSRSSRSPEPFYNGVNGHRKPSPDKTTSYIVTSSRRSGSRGFRGTPKSSIDEQEEYTYNENNAFRPSRKYTPEQNGIGNRQSSVSIDGLRKPKIDSWDSMGILGLTAKIWNDTRTRQETFMESTGHLLREESSSYIM